MVEEGHGAANVGRVPVGDVCLIGPEVEERHVARALWPAVRQEELGELVELEVDVEEDHRLLGLLQLVEQESRLERNRLVTKHLGALGRVGPEVIGADLRRLAADAQLRDTYECNLGGLAPHAHQDLLRVVEGHRGAVVPDLALLGVVGHRRVLRKGKRARPLSPHGIVGRGLEQCRVHARAGAGVGLVVPVVGGAGAGLGAINALVLRDVGAARPGLPRALDHLHELRAPRRQRGRVDHGLVRLDGRVGAHHRLLADAVLVKALRVGRPEAIERLRRIHAPGVGHAVGDAVAPSGGEHVVAHGQVRVAGAVAALRRALGAAFDRRVIPREPTAAAV
eukprot:scaffold53844_cov66-Phaeocystis_antarctica.AAC.2